MFLFRLTQSDNSGLPRSLPWDYDVERVVTGDAVETSWVLRLENPPVRRVLRARNGEYVGVHVPGQAGEWADCDWQPAVVYIPLLVAGTERPFDSRCDVRRSDGDVEHHHMIGSTKVVGTKQVVVHDRTLTVWVVERQWHARTTGSTTFESIETATGWWSPDLKMLVRQESTYRQVANVPDPHEARGSFRMIGLQEHEPSR